MSEREYIRLRGLKREHVHRVGNDEPVTLLLPRYFRGYTEGEPETIEYVDTLQADIFSAGSISVRRIVFLDSVPIVYEGSEIPKQTVDYFAACAALDLGHKHPGVRQLVDYAYNFR